MTDAERVLALRIAAEAVSRAQAELSAAWGTLEQRQANRTATERIADAGNLLGRAQQKLKKAIELLTPKE